MVESYRQANGPATSIGALGGRVRFPGKIRNEREMSQVKHQVQKLAFFPFENGDAGVVQQNDRAFPFLLENKPQVDQVRFVQRKKAERFQQFSKLADVV